MLRFATILVYCSQERERNTMKDRWNIQKPSRENGFNSGRPSAYQVQIHGYSDHILQGELFGTKRSLDNLKPEQFRYKFIKREYEVMLECLNEEIQWRKENTK